MSKIFYMKYLIFLRKQRKERRNMFIEVLSFEVLVGIIKRTNNKN